MNRKRRIRRRLTQVVLLGVAILLAILGLNVGRSASKQLRVAAVPVVPLPETALIQRLATAVSIQTVSHQNPARIDSEPFERFAAFLEESFPAVHQRLDLLTGAEFGDPRNRSLLFRWQGSDPQQRDAILLMAHYDVVPAPLETVDRWTHPPFAGVVDDRYVWGRGTLDVKDGAMALMEATEHLLREDFRPRRTVYLSLGHDEEVGGTHGNAKIAQWMRQQGIRLQMVLDEGGCILNDFPGIDAPVALIGVAEKGYVTVRLTARLDDSGHSSMPPAETAIGLLASALNRIATNPLPRRLDGGAGLMLRYVGPEMPLTGRLAIANRWLFSELIKDTLGATPSGNATLRTTIAPTMIEGGVKENVLPAEAQATVNIRILPGDTVAGVLAYAQRVIADERIELQPMAGAKEPSRFSSTDSAAFRMLHTTIKQIFPEVVVAPYVVIGGTDASNFDEVALAKDVYRFIPARLDDEDLKRIHGIDERIGRRDYLDIVRFYIQLIKASQQ